MTAEIETGVQQGPRQHLGEKRSCCGDPTDLDGGRHPWVMIGENGQGVGFYRCPWCKAETTDD